MEFEMRDEYARSLFAAMLREKERIDAVLNQRASGRFDVTCGRYERKIS